MRCVGRAIEFWELTMKMRSAAVAFVVVMSVPPAPADAGRDVQAAQDARSTFTVGTASATRGQKAYGVIQVPAGSDAGYDIPVVVVHGAKPGPVLAVVSGAHGSDTRRSSPLKCSSTRSNRPTCRAR